MTFEFLAAQRRAIYERLEKPAPWWSALSSKRWASVAATALVLVGGVAVYQEKRPQPVTENQLSDAQLAQEVSRMSQEYEAQPTAPLQGLFE